MAVPCSWSGTDRNRLCLLSYQLLLTPQTVPLGRRSVTSSPRMGGEAFKQQQDTTKNNSGTAAPERSLQQGDQPRAPARAGRAHRRPVGWPLVRPAGA